MRSLYIDHDMYLPFLANFIVNNARSSKKRHRRSPTSTYTIYLVSSHGHLASIMCGDVGGGRELARMEDMAALCRVS